MPERVRVLAPVLITLVVPLPLLIAPLKVLPPELFAVLTVRFVVPVRELMMVPAPVSRLRVGLRLLRSRVPVMLAVPLPAPYGMASKTPSFTVPAVMEVLPV